MESTFEIILSQNANLLVLKKTDVDLFILSQTGILTYLQLDRTKIHGDSGARLSIKRIEKKGYIKAKTVGHDTNMKYYYLTSIGKKYVQKIYGNYLSLLGIDLSLKIPSSAYQLPHRIRANDFYYAYISAPKSMPAVWTPEKKLFDSNEPNMHPPRADGYLNLFHHAYYIEQDMATQPEGTITAKIQHYIDRGILHHSAKNILVFTVYCSPKPDETVTSPYLVYRILLKLLKAWAVYGTEHSYAEIEQQIDADGKKIRFLSIRDMQLIRNLQIKTPFSTFDELQKLKEHYRKDQTYNEKYLQKQDSAFQKRFYSHFFSLCEKLPYLKFLLEKDTTVFVIPNHRITLEIPHILTEEFIVEDQYKKIIYQTGFDISLLTYTPQMKIAHDSSELLFKHTFSSDDLLIAVENIHDLSATVRIRKIWLQTNLNKRIFFILLTGDSNESAVFFHALQSFSANTSVSLFFYNMYKPGRPYRFKTGDGQTNQLQYISIYHDFYTGKVEIIDE